MKLTIGQKILLGFGLAMLFMAITGIAAYRSTERLLEANGWVRHTFQVIGAAEDIRADLLEFESACRGYVLTGDAQFPGIDRRACGRAWPRAGSCFERSPPTIPVNSAGSTLWIR